MRRLTTYYILLCCLLLAGCIKEDRTNCFQKGNVELAFSYFGDGAYDIFASIAEKADIFVYNDVGDLVAVYTLSKSDLNIRQGIDMALEPGNYKVVCWINAMQNTVIMGTECLADAKICNPDFCAENPIQTNDKLYYGYYDLLVPETGGVHGDVRFLNAYIGMDIYIHGTNISRQNYPTLELDNLYAQYDFMCNAARGDDGNPLRSSYYPAQEYDQDKGMVVSRFNVLSFEQDNSVNIIIKDNSAGSVNLVELQLAQFLKDNNIDVENRQERNVEILVTLNQDLSVEITVPEWGRPEIKPEI